MKPITRINYFIPINSNLSIGQIFNFLKKRLNETEAELILKNTCNLSRSQLFLENKTFITEKQSRQITVILKKRLNHEPLQYILGKTNFYGLDIFVGAGVLIPRPETEILVEKSLKLIPQKANLLDLCTGSAAIALAIKLKRPDINVTASDISIDAIKFANKNRRFHKLNINLIQSDLFDNIPQKEFNLICANPPYISTKLYNNLNREIKDFEPKISLHSGQDGLNLIRLIITQAKEYLTSNGYLLMEVCSTHINIVKKIFQKNNYHHCKIFNDYTQRARFCLGQVH